MHITRRSNRSAEPLSGAPTAGTLAGISGGEDSHPHRPARKLRLPPARTSQRLQSGVWLPVSRVPRVFLHLRERQGGGDSATGAKPIGPRKHAASSRGHFVLETADGFGNQEPASRGCAVVSVGAGAEEGSTRRNSARHADGLSVHAGDKIPLPHLPMGLVDESEDSVRSLATMVVAYHQTVPSELQEEFIRQVMKFAGEQAGQLIRKSWG